MRLALMGRYLLQTEALIGLIDLQTTSKVPEASGLGEVMIGVHDNLKTARRPYALAVYGLTDRIDVGCAGLADGLRPHPEADEGRLHRIGSCPWRDKGLTCEIALPLA